MNPCSRLTKERPCQDNGSCLAFAYSASDADSSPSGTLRTPFRFSAATTTAALVSESTQIFNITVVQPIAECMPAFFNNNFRCLQHAYCYT